MTIALSHLFAAALALLAKLIPLCFGISKVKTTRTYLGVAFISIGVFLAQLAGEIVILLVLFGGIGMLVDAGSMLVLGSYILSQIPTSQFQLLFGASSFFGTLGILSWCWHLSSKQKVVS
jgi:hypothetical protein